MKELIVILLLCSSINIFAKEKKRIISKIDYEIISAELIKKQISFISYISNKKINILDENLISMVHDIVFSENLLLENKKFQKKNQYFIQQDKKFDQNIQILIKSFQVKSKKNNNKIINKRGKAL